MMAHRPKSQTLLRVSAWMAILVASAASVHAQTPYKVVGPDGKITYTDRPPLTTADRVSPVGSGGAGNAEVTMPLELRQPVARFPVTLYVTVDDCSSCTDARQLLRQRGIPFTEKQVQSDDDLMAFERLSGGREAPTLGIGAQILRGLSAEVWNSYLDAAGYPRESRLPSNYQYPAATPLVARAVPRPAPAPEVQADGQPTVPSLPNAAGIRF